MKTTEQLSFVNLKYFLNNLQLNHDFLLYQQVNFVSSLNEYSVVSDWQAHLRSNAQSALRQLML